MKWHDDTQVSVTWLLFVLLVFAAMLWWAWPDLMLWIGGA